MLFITIMLKKLILLYYNQDLGFYCVREKQHRKTVICKKCNYRILGPWVYFYKNGR